MDSYVLIDGGFLRKRCSELHTKLRAEDVPYVAKQLLKQESSDEEQYRIYYYDCPPSSQEVTLPVSGEIHRFSQDSLYAQQMLFLNQLKDLDHVWVREGVLSFQGWQLRRDVYDRKFANPIPVLDDSCFLPQFEQKEIDTLIAMDILQVSWERTVTKLFLIAGDTDFAPALRHAREHYIPVYLFTLGNKVKQVLRENADVVVTEPLRTEAAR